MSYSNANVEITYDGNGSDDSFGVNFHYLEGVTASIIAELWDYTDPDLPVKESFVLGVDYTIDESNYPNTLVNTAVPVAVDYKLIMYRSTVPIQTSNFVNGAFPAKSVEEGLDKVMMATQEQSAKMDRALLNPIGGPSIDIDQLLAGLDQVQVNSDNISDNATNIATNASSILINASNISSNAGAISANSADITTLQGQVGLIAPEVLVPLATASSTYAASILEILLVQASDITIDLPAPVLSGQVKVKMDGLQSNCIVQSASGIDGFGTSYTLSSTYESLSFVSDGTQWYII